RLKGDKTPLFPTVVSREGLVGRRPCCQR
ncbi:hydroxamate siderophore iron reductase FhuF, partial [Cronobacter sakazakii]